MIELGKIQNLSVVRLTSVGAYLGACEDVSGDAVLLPQSQVPQGLAVGDTLEVFVYKDSEDRVISTVRTPKITLGALSVLKVAEITKIGAFLDWGLEKDLFLPFKEQEGEIKKGNDYLVALYVDNSGRLCATMKLYTHLLSSTPFKEKAWVQGTVYSLNSELGYFVAVENRYHGLIALKEAYGKIAIGDQVSTRVKKVRPDGKLELSMREPAYKEIEGDAHQIMTTLKAHKGTLALNDASAPERIKAELNMSKSAFKRAIGRLLKEGAIRITAEGIETVWK